MQTHLIVEMSPFRLAEGVSDEMLLKASEILERDFLSHQAGFIKRELMKGDGDYWIDIVYWASESDSKAATRNASESNESFTYFELMDFGDPHEPELGALHVKVAP